MIDNQQAMVVKQQGQIDQLTKAMKSQSAVMKGLFAELKEVRKSIDSKSVNSAE